MQQYFSDMPLEVGDEYVFDNKQRHHAKNVVRLDNKKIRLVYRGQGYFARCERRGNDFVAVVEEKDECVNELGVELILVVGLIRKEKFELILQKASELGVTKVIPFISSRCIIKPKKEKSDKVLARYKDILKEAAEQCKRNKIPSIISPIDFKDILKYKSELNFVPYERGYGKSPFLSDKIDGEKSVTMVIGPEGGFSEEEIEFLIENGFLTVTFGSRILRAETAAIYGCSIVCESIEKSCL